MEINGMLFGIPGAENVISASLWVSQKTSMVGLEGVSYIRPVTFSSITHNVSSNTENLRWWKSDPLLHCLHLLLKMWYLPLSDCLTRPLWWDDIVYTLCWREKWDLLLSDCLRRRRWWDYIVYSLCWKGDMCLSLIVSQDLYGRMI